MTREEFLRLIEFGGGLNKCKLTLPNWDGAFVIPAAVANYTFIAVSFSDDPDNDHQYESLYAFDDGNWMVMNLDYNNAIVKNQEGS